MGYISFRRPFQMVNTEDLFEPKGRSRGGELRGDFTSLGISKLEKSASSSLSNSAPLTPLLRALTLSAGEHKVSGGESRVSRQVGLPHNLRAPRSKPKKSLPLFLAAFSRLLSCRHGRATGVLLRVHGPCRRLRDSRLN